MVVDRLKYLLFVLLLWGVCVPVLCCDAQPADTTFVFKKMPIDTVVVKTVTVKQRRQTKKGAAAKKKKKVSAPKKAAAGAVKDTVVKSAPKRVAKRSNDSVLYEERHYSLGDRVIMRGDSGADVKKLAEIMVKNFYLDENSIPYTKSGKVLYEGELLRAVKLFQKVSGLYDDGIVGTTTIKELRKIHRWRRSSQ